MQENKSKFNLKNILSVFLAILLLVLAFYIYSSKKNTTENKNIEISKITSTKEVSETEEFSKAKSSVSENPISKTVKIKADVWVDNWFAFYLGDKLVKEDSVSINMEKSFNKESFTFEATYPLQFNFIAKDYKANDTGLEYIGTNRQQMGDGGLIAQFTDIETGEVIAVTNSDWKTKVIHTAPIDTGCEVRQNPKAGIEPCTYLITSEPVNWKSLDFDDMAWPKANMFSEAEVKPKDGYNQINWDKEARFIWSPDLYKDNTILMRLKLEEKINTIKNID